MKTRRLRIWRPAPFGVLVAVVLFSAVHNISPANAQGADFERTIRDCMDNGFSRAECVIHAEKVHNAERSDAERYQQEQRRRLEEQSRQPRPRPRHPGRRDGRP